MLQTPSDFFIRRTGRLYFDIDSVLRLLDSVLAEYEQLFQVDSTKVSAHKKEIEDEVKRHADFDLEGL